MAIGAQLGDILRPIVFQSTVAFAVRIGASICRVGLLIRHLASVVEEVNPHYRGVFAILVIVVTIIAAFP